MSKPIFPKWANNARLLLALALLGGPLYAVVLFAYGASPDAMAKGYRPIQPVPFSHRLHAGELGLDCRFCHNTVENAYFAAVPPADTCMNCHTHVRPTSTRLEKVRGQFTTDSDGVRIPDVTADPIEWEKVHDLPDYVYFNHAAHIQNGVSCVSCHGRIDTMDVVQQVEPLSMGWCLDCHRDPAEYLRPVDEVTNLAWRPEDSGYDSRRELGEMLMKKNDIHPPTDCSTCHR